MDYLLFKTLHVAAVITLFTSLGATLLAGSGKKGAAILHGVSLLVILLTGLHILVSNGLVKSGGWWHAKIVLWLFIGLAPALAKRKVMPAWVVLVLTLLAGIGAAWLGIRKPF